MIISRLVSLILRFGEFVCAAVVLGLTAHFLDQYNHVHIGPLGREIYTIIIASLSVVFSLIWLIPTTRAMLHIPADLFFTAAWFAAFGVLYKWNRNIGCGGFRNWGIIHIEGNTYCGEWKAAMAFSFISACLWFASVLVGFWTWNKYDRNAVVADAPVRRRRWHRSRV